MKRTILLFIALIVVILLVIAGANFFLKNFSSLIPLASTPPINVAEHPSDLPFSLPDGFSISVYAKDLEKPRDMLRDPAGNLLVSIPSEGKVVALVDDNDDGISDRTITVIEGLNHPHGLATHCFPVGGAVLEFDCNVYIAETDQVGVYAYDRELLKATDKRTIITLPRGGNHTTRSIIFGTGEYEGTLFTSVGSSCNVCIEDNQNRAVILASGPLGENLRVFATGLRNSVFMALHPATGELWATDMGRDLLGDDIPPDEINIVREGHNYGWPTCYGANIHDVDFDKNVYVRAPCSEPFETPSYIDVIPAHSSPLGLAFIAESGWPRDYSDDVFVAYHGSWNRSTPSGYKVVRYALDEAGNYEKDANGAPLVFDFITGFLTDKGGIIGRPVDILVESRGTMYVSDDRAGVIYRVQYTK